jgi:hypothetical protein
VAAASLLGVSHAQDATYSNNMYEQGSILVYPLIDNIYRTTIIGITNRANTDVWLQGFMIVHPPGKPTEFEKKDFLIHLTQKEPFVWNTSRAYDRVDVDGIRTQIQGFYNLKGFLFVWAINTDKDRLEIEWNYLLGSAVLINGLDSFAYSPIPHQGLDVAGDRVLNLDGLEYTMATSEVVVEGFAENWPPGMTGTWAVCSLDIDFINSIQPEFDINLGVWNQYEVYQSRHLHFYQFVQYDLYEDLQLRIDQIFTPKFCFTSTSTDAIWSIFFQVYGPWGWGGNVWQRDGTGVPATVILPPVPHED